MVSEIAGVIKPGGGDPVIVVRCVVGFAPPSMTFQHLNMLLLVQWFTVGTHSRCLREWKTLMTSFFHEVKVIYTTRGSKMEEEEEEIFFFYGKLMKRWPPSNKTRIGGDGLMDPEFLTTPLSSVEILSLT